MSKKHFIKIAKAINEVSKINHDNQSEAVFHVAHRLADIFKEENPNFDAARFFAACNVQH